MNECILCLGSNHQAETNLKIARQQLRIYFADILFLDEIETNPIGMSNPSMFINQVAYLKTNMGQEQIKKILKEVEYKCGRTAQDKEHEMVRIDIDLLQFNTIKLKSDDLNRDYVVNSLKQLSSILHK